MSTSVAPLLSFEQSADPRVSIIIPTLRNASLLRQCLQALRRNVGPAVASEVIVHVNGANPEALQMLSTEVEGVRVIVAEVNRGFGGSCNRAAEAARGEFLAFLNDDTEVQPGWLEALLATADEHAEAGAIGSLVSVPDGTIQEVGSFVWRDGSSVAVGRGLPAESHAYPSLRPVDYCSACSLLVRRSLWEAAGGFDERYFPAYYEDVDLCFTIRQLGKQVLCQPESRVLHHEAMSSLADYREFLMHKHRRSFVEKWAAKLGERELPDAASARAITEDPRAIQEIERRITRNGEEGSGVVSARHSQNLQALDSDNDSPPLSRRLMTELETAERDRWYLERDLALRDEFLTEMRARLSEVQGSVEGLARTLAAAQADARRLAESEALFRERVQALGEILGQPRHSLAERANLALKRNAALLHRALKSLLSSGGVS